MKISITNHTGSRNRGCEALVLSKILGIGEILEGAKFSIHSNDPLYDQWRFKKHADVLFSYPLNTPNHFNNISLNSIIYRALYLTEKLLPNINNISFNSIANIGKSDLVISSGGDIFTSDYGNLRKHLSYPIIGKSKEKKVYLCSHSIGPFNKKDKDYFLRCCEKIDFISAREKDSYEYLKAIDAQTEYRLTADVAFSLPSLEESKAKNLLSTRYNLINTENLVAISISQGIIRYSNLDHDSYYQLFADLCDYLISIGKKIILIPHVMERNPNNNDVIACDHVVSKMKSLTGVTVISGEPSAVDFKGIIGLCECLIGTRTHATIAAMSQRIPTVSIAYSRKAYGIMKDVYGQQLGSQLTIDANKLNINSLIEAYQLSISNKILESKISEIKKLSKENFSIAANLLK